MQLPVMPPIKPMLARATTTVPEADGLLYEPKWDGYRCVVFRDGDEVELSSRGQKSLTRYFPELIDPIRAQLPRRCVVDCEVVVVTPDGLDFDLLGQRIHPAESRIERLSVETPASLVVFDLLALDEVDLRPMAFIERRGALVSLLADVIPPVHLSPVTDDPEVAQDWFRRFEGAGFDGVMAKRSDGVYEEDKRSVTKVKHRHSIDVVVAGYRPHKSGDGVGSMMLGLYDRPEGDRAASLQHVGVASAFKAAQRPELAELLAPYRLGEGEPHPWTGWADPEQHADGGVRMPGAPNRWSAKRDHSWVPLRPELVAEVVVEQLTKGRFRHPARFQRWRSDRTPRSCTYDQVDIAAPAELFELFPEAPTP